MSGYLCTRCGRSDDEARFEGCARGPCPMALVEEKPSTLTRLVELAIVAGVFCAAVILLTGCASSSPRAEAGDAWRDQLCIVRQATEVQGMSVILLRCRGFDESSISSAPLRSLSTKGSDGGEKRSKGDAQSWATATGQS